MTTYNLSDPIPTVHAVAKPARPVDTQSKQKKLMLTAFALGLLFFGLLATGLLMWLVLESGPGGDKYFLNMHRHAWGDLHASLGLLFTGIVVFHLLLHWGWLRTVTPRQLRAGGWLRGLGRFFAVALVLTLAAAGLFLGLHGTDVTAGRGQGQGRGEGRGRIEQPAGEGQLDDAGGGLRMRRGRANRQATGDTPLE